MTVALQTGEKKYESMTHRESKLGAQRRGCDLPRRSILENQHNYCNFGQQQTKRDLTLLQPCSCHLFPFTGAQFEGLKREVYLLVSEVPQFLVAKGQHSRPLMRNFCVDSMIVAWALRQLEEMWGKVTLIQLQTQFSSTFQYFTLNMLRGKRSTFG